MSNLRKSILTPGSSKAGSRVPSRSNSRAPTSRLVSSPTSNDSDDDEEFSFNGLDDLIQSKLDNYLTSIANTISDDEKDDTKLNTHSIPDLLHSLSMPRTTVSTEAREILLARLYHLILCKPLSLHEGLVNEYDTEQLIKYYQTARTENEKLLTLKVITTYCCSDIEEVSSIVISDFLPYLNSQLKDVENVALVLRSNIMISYASFLLCIYDGSGAYGLDDTILTILEICEGLLNCQEHLQESDVIVNGLHAVGLILTVIYHAQTDMNELLEDIMPRIVSFVETGDLNLSKASGRVIALIYELYDYNDDEEEEEEDNENVGPYYDNEQLYSLMNSLSTISSKNINKKLKKESKSVFRDVLLTMDSYSTRESRLEVLKNPLTLSHLKLSKSRSLAIRSWYSFIRIIHLRYVFNGGLHDNLLSNPELNNLLKKPRINDKFSKFDELDEDQDQERTFGLDRKRKLTGKKKDIAMSNARAEKLARELGDLNL